MQTYQAALQWGLEQIPQSLEAAAIEQLLLHILHISRSQLFAWPERALTDQEWQGFMGVVQRYLKGEPVAYIIGHAGFWTLDLKVTPDTLIPRPETEILVETVLTLLPQNKAQIADLGTGSGAIALAIASEKPQFEIHATDISEKALTVAKHNALPFKNVVFHHGDWCGALPHKRFDAIISNPPYIAKHDTHLEARVKESEPHLALFAENQGFSAFECVIQEAENYLLPGGYLLFEHGFQQAERLRFLLEKARYTGIQTVLDNAGMERVTYGRK